VKVLLTGAGGMLARSLHDVLTARDHDVASFARRALDVTDAQRVHAVIAAAKPDVVVHCAAFTRVDDAEHQEELAIRINADSAQHAAMACRQIGARFVYPSTDYVFDGAARVPYVPDAPTAPLNAYGRSKLEGEIAARAAGDALIVRTSWLYAAHGRNFVRTMLERARAGHPLRIVDDQRGAPTATGDLATLIVLLLERRAPAGVYHATNRGDTTWFGLACVALEIAGVAATVSPVTSADFPQIARRPMYSVLDCTATYAVAGPAPHWRDALRDVIGQTIGV
jgi:dTDP-4-dehydrorhamnose reductase